MNKILPIILVVVLPGYTNAYGENISFTDIVDLCINGFELCKK